MVTVDRQFHPDAERHMAYRYYVQKYRETYQQLRLLMRDMTTHLQS
jgi:sugar (pentulose or hexulose) kinase